MHMRGGDHACAYLLIDSAKLFIPSRIVTSGGVIAGLHMRLKAIPILLL
jgi:hypothetical protein